MVRDVPTQIFSDCDRILSPGQVNRKPPDSIRGVYTQLGVPDKIEM